MKKIIILSAIIMIALSCKNPIMEDGKKSFYDYKVNDISGEEFDMASLKGKKVLVVNTASRCGFTPQYEQLQELYEQYGGENFEIIGFPSNDFLKQDPGSNEEIAQFCQANYGVTFPMMEKVVVKGKKKDPIYKWLTDKKLNGFENSRVKWNFQKYLINEDGTIYAIISSKTSPKSDSIVNWIND